jgi:hypothetical protein
MEKDELFELVVALTAKNIALEEQIKSFDEQLDIAVKKLNACINDGEEFDYDEDEDEDDSDYYPPHPSFVPGDDDPAYPYNEPDGISPE